MNNTEICLRTCLRIVDANLNRTAEGLRVAEDIVRFYLNDRKLQVSFKAL
ncbi:MAG: thiamine phosphate synthase, partial [Candidatus Omnitrophica bacterium]|nr:thiamine phosphate synthase [Candidatus Omnitrophota bacterium]